MGRDRNRRRPRHTHYQLWHVLPQGTRQRVGPLVTSWPEAVSRADLLVTALQAELAQGNPDAGGEVWVINADNGTIAWQVSIQGGESAG